MSMEQADAPAGSRHQIYFGDAATSLASQVADKSVQLVVTSPPYWCVRDYGHDHQIGYAQALPAYLASLDEVWDHCARVLLPDGKLAVNIGNIYYSLPGETRRTTANLTLLLWERLCRLPDLRFMGTIYWQKTTSRAGAVLFGSYPYPSNFMISNAVEAIFVFRKVGSRWVPPAVREQSRVTKEEFRVWRDALWHINGAAADKHAAAFPVELPYRLIRLYSFVGDTVLDPFAGSASTTAAAIRAGRDSIACEVNPDFFPLMTDKLRLHPLAVPGDARVEVHRPDAAVEVHWGAPGP